MQVTATGTSAATQSTASTAGSSSNSALSETQFLQLLTEQLENQDPLQPEDDTQFLAQMAQFTSLQETDTLNQQVERISASNYIGQMVTVNPSNTAPVTGTVSGIDTSGTDPQVVINGSEYPLAEVQFVTTQASTATPTASSTPTTTPSSTASAQAAAALAAVPAAVPRPKPASNSATATTSTTQP